MSGQSYVTPAAIVSGVPYKSLEPGDFSEIGENCTTGLFAQRVNPKIKPTDIIEYLKTLNFGLDRQIDDIWDCSERALWGIVHARHKFPGCAIGLAEGKNSKKENHAVIIIWESDLKKYIYFDPLSPQKNADFGSEVRIIAFPFNALESSEPVEIIGKSMSRIKDNNYVSWDAKYNIYPLTDAKNRNGVLDYLSTPLYDKYCVDLPAHPSVNEADFKNYWKDLDRAFWSYMHVRRQYDGCAIGVAIGDPEPKKSHFVNIIWTEKKEGENHKYIFWDPSPEIRNIVSFKPKRIFF